MAANGAFQRQGNRSRIHFDNGVSRDVGDDEMERLREYRRRQQQEMDRWRTQFHQFMQRMHLRVKVSANNFLCVFNMNSQLTR